jgi:hypothetical protein
MDTVTILIALNSLVVTIGGFFVTMWIRGVNTSIKELYERKVSNDDFKEYKIFATTERLKNSNLIERFSTHQHLIKCTNEECGRPITEGVMIR